MGVHRSVDVSGVRLAYQVCGPRDAPPLVLLHAMGETSGDWDEVAPALAADHRIHALDLRGHGRSDWPGVYSLTLMRDDVLGFLDALGLDRVHLVGHSMGGAVAYLVAQADDRRVGRLVLEDVPAPRPRKPSAAVRPDGELPFDWDLVPAVRRQIDTPEPEWLERLAAITAPTLALAGGGSSHIPQAGIAELVRRVPRGRMVTIETGHLIHRTQPERFVAEVREFLDEPAHLPAGTKGERP
ncbi:alpha/beta hydrolase [Streptomyces sp. NPDC005727]|uniref:alpha/beta fold hydrolase n=1 Tax=Streptomyces sp. NPDC005727 TaxID=3157053 RepID=UPI0033E4FB81